MKQDYTTFRARFMSDFGITVGNIAGQGRNIDKLWAHPTTAMYESMIDRTFKNLHGNYKAGGVIKPAKNKVQAVKIGSSTLRPEDVVSDNTHEEEPLQLIPTVLTRGINGAGVIWGEASTSRAVVEELLPKNKRNDRAFVREVEGLVDALTSNPFSMGTFMLQTSKGNKTKLYRRNPVHSQGATRAVKSVRIIFSVDRESGSIGLYSITTDHQDYEQVIDGLAKANL